jgi:hypothetical protein
MGDVISTIIEIVLVLILLLSPPLFIGSCIASIYSKGVRAKIKRHKWLFASWGVSSLLCILILSAIVSAASGVIGTAKKARTIAEQDQIHTAILNYETEYGKPSPATDNAGIKRELEGDNPRKIEFINIKPQDLNDKRELMDAWGTPFRISVADPDHPVIQSAGPDKQWNTPDDMNWGKSRSYRH